MNQTIGRSYIARRMNGSLNATILTDLTPEMNEMRVKDEMSLVDDEFEENFNPDIPQTQTPSIVDEIDIKYEDVDYPHRISTTETDSDVNSNLENIPRVRGSSDPEGKHMKDFYRDLLHCDPDCETCVEYLRMLSAHVRAAHAPPPFISIQDPELIDPLHIDPDAHNAHQSSSFVIGIKSEPVETVEEMEYAEEESETKDQLSHPEYESESVNDPDYTPPPSHHNSQHIHCQWLTNNKGSSDSKISNAKKGILPSRKQLKCDVCNKIFSNKNFLTAHMKTHTVDGPFKWCDVCGKGFGKTSHLTEHKRSHTGERPLTCHECGKSFKFNSNLTIHKRIHTGGKPFQCTECEQRFTTSRQMIQHRKMSH